MLCGRFHRRFAALAQPNHFFRLLEASEHAGLKQMQKELCLRMKQEQLVCNAPTYGGSATSRLKAIHSAAAESPLFPSGTNNTEGRILQTIVPHRALQLFAAAIEEGLHVASLPVGEHLKQGRDGFVVGGALEHAHALHHAFLWKRDEQAQLRGRKIKRKQIRLVGSEERMARISTSSSSAQEKHS